MPVATSNIQATERKELKSLPEGFVVLRRMTYGQICERRAMLKLSIATGRGNKGDLKGEMAMANREITMYEFSHCIVDHNLEKDVNGTVQKLNLSDPVDFASLDPRVGQEIERYITEMNDFEDDDQEN